MRAANLSGHWDAAVKASSALRAVVLSVFQDDVGTHIASEVARIPWHLESSMTTLTSAPELHELLPCEVA